MSHLPKTVISPIFVSTSNLFYLSAEFAASLINTGFCLFFELLNKSGTMFDLPNRDLRKVKD